ncbi:Sister chromatid cohesion protein 2 [Serendipita sp. 399]|nr:Sister chromatid cohesion protein 2 [Serendipita sp. 399]
MDDPSLTPNKWHRQQALRNPDPRALLATYPMASVTPVMHVGRHLSTLTDVAPTPIYMQPHRVPNLVPDAFQDANSRSRDYIERLSSQRIPTGGQDRAFWDANQQQAARLIAQQASVYHQPSHPQHQSMSIQHQYYAPAFAPQNPPTPFAQSILSSVPFTSRGYSNGVPNSAGKVHYPPPEDSPRFFHDFLEAKSKEIRESSVTNAPVYTTPQSFSSTPFLNDRSQGPRHQMDTPTSRTMSISPQKRKAEGEHAHSPSMKRVQSNDHMAWSPMKSQQTSIPVPASASTAHPNQIPYISVPPMPHQWQIATPVKNLAQPRHQLPSVKSTPATPTPRKTSEDGWKAESVDGYPSSGAPVPPSTQSRTGDGQNSLDKLTSYLEDIFEAEDTLPADSPVEDMESFEFFSKLTTDWSHPRLSIKVMNKLTKIVDQIAQPTKRARRDALFHSPGMPEADSLASLEISTLSRIIKLLERSVTAGEDVDPFAGPVVKLSGSGSAPEATDKSPTKGKKAKRGKSPEGRKTRSKSRTPVDTGVDELGVDGEGNVDLAKVENDLNLARESVLAVDVCLALLSADHLPKQLYSEELITACLNSVKNQLTRIVYPFLEANNDIQDQISKALLTIVKNSDHYSKTQRSVLSDIFQAIVSIFPRIDKLVGRPGFSMSESITIQSVFIAIGPFFVAEPPTEGRNGKVSVIASALGGTTALRGLRLSALSLIQSLFANNEDQRQWIVEEILTSLIKLPDLKHKGGQFRLRDGKSIHTVSALLFQLVQTSPHLLRLECQTLAKQRKLALPPPNAIFSDIDKTEMALYLKGLDSAHRVAKTIVVFLTQRSGKTKTAKSSNEAEYRAILDNLVSDLLTVLYLPEWPAASLILGVLTRLFVASLDDVKTNASVDNSATKSTALDHLGTIAARLRNAVLNANAENAKTSVVLCSLDEALKQMDMEKVSLLITAHEETSKYLAHKANEDQSYSSAQDLSGASWGYELANALTNCENRLQQSEGPVDEQSLKPLLDMIAKIKASMQDVWKSVPIDVFSIGSQGDTARADKIAERLGSLSSLNAAFDPILSVILGSLDAAAVFMRTKALRALGQILSNDASILQKANVRQAIEEHLLDNSPAVRDAAVELIGKYVVQQPQVADAYYEKVADRILDTGLGVRKRVIKLLKVFYISTEDVSRRVDISSRLVHRMLDEDDGVKDLAVKSLEELWFGSEIWSSQALNDEEEKSRILPIVTVILGVVAQKDRQGNVGDFLHKIIIDRSDRDKETLQEQFTKICDTLIDTLVDDKDGPGYSILSCVRAVQIFVAAQPSIISSSKAITLLPYLKHASTTEEQMIADNLLRIFRACIPAMTKTATKFGHELQSNLQVMIVKPSPTGGLQTMQEAIACFCVVVTNLTHEFGRVIGLLKSCLARLNDAAKKYQLEPSNATLNRQIQLLVCMVALIGEHCDLDKIREDRRDLVSEINAITKSSVNEHIYGNLMKLYSKLEEPGLRNRILQCLGFMFRAYPTLMTHPTSADMMDQIFASDDNDVKGKLLKILQDFLSFESAKHSAQEKAALTDKTVGHSVDMEAFVGNTHGFAESGVSSAIVQRYLRQILDAALVNNPQIQNSAVDILGFTIKQGLAHPLHCLPQIVALETADNQQLSGRASALHTILHSKHASLIHSRYFECAQVAFKYQQKVMGEGAVCGYRYTTVSTAVFHRWYSLVKEKRQTRMDFIRAITKCFDVDSTRLSATQEDVDFVRFIVENLSALEYKTQEEILGVIRYAVNVLSVAGMQMMEILSPSDLMRQLGDFTGQQNTSTSELLSIPSMLSFGRRLDLAHIHIQARTFEPFSMARASVILAMILLLKSYLKNTYGLSEEKCAKWIPGKKSAIGDKPAVRKLDRPLVWEKLPFATKAIATEEDVKNQQDTFIQLWEADPVIVDPEEDVPMTDPSPLNLNHVNNLM